jgi:hypothetical protein
LILLSLLGTFPISGRYELHLKKQRSAGPWRACGALDCIRLGCEGPIWGHYLLLYWISQSPLDDILLQNRDRRLISLPQYRLLTLQGYPVTNHQSKLDALIASLEVK